MLVLPQAQSQFGEKFFPFLFVFNNLLEQNWHLMPRLKCILYPFFCSIKIIETLLLLTSPYV